jgi:hypothetical protein
VKVYEHNMNTIVICMKPLILCAVYSSEFNWNRNCNTDEVRLRLVWCWMVLYWSTVARPGGALLSRKQLTTLLLPVTCVTSLVHTSQDAWMQVAWNQTLQRLDQCELCSNYISSLLKGLFQVSRKVETSSTFYLSWTDLNNNLKNVNYLTLHSIGTHENSCLLFR